MTPARWQPTAEEVRHAVRAVRSTAPFVARHATRLVGVVLAAIGLVLVLFGLPGSALIGTGTGWVLIGWFFADRGPWHNRFVQQPVEAVLTEDGLQYTGTGAVRFVSSWSWTDFRYAVETPDQFVLVGFAHRTGFVPYLPKRALADPAAVRALLADRLEVRAGR